MFVSVTDSAKVQIDGILFDLDGVILDSEGLHDEALLGACRHFGFDPGQISVLHYKGWTEPAVAVDVLKKNPETSVTVEQFIARKDKNYVALAAERLTLVPGAADFLKRCSDNGLPTGLVTSALRTNAEGPLRRFCLDQYFRFLITGDDVKNGKPHPEPYQKGVSLLNFPAHRVMVIEDAVNGIRSAKAAGCIGVGLTTSFPREALISAGADVAAASYKEITHLVF